MKKSEFLRKELKKNADKKQADILQRFFKTGKGEYGEGDVFLGIKVPVQRKICKNYLDLDFFELENLLKSDVHEERFCAVIILVDKYIKGIEEEKKKVFDFYIKNSHRFNNWDLVDVSAPKIVGGYLLNRDKGLLYDFAKSDNLWQRRISVISTLYFIKNNNLNDSFKICEILINDKHDLINKAVGWVLRELGKKDLILERRFLDKYCKTMPRVTLRYSLEKMNKEDKKLYMMK